MPKQYYQHHCRYGYRQRNNQKTNLIMQGFSASTTLFVVSIALLAGLYVFITNASVVRGAQIHALEQDIHHFERENAELDIQLAEMSTLDYVSETIAQQEMVPLEQPLYLTETHRRVAILSSIK